MRLKSVAKIGRKVEMHFCQRLMHVHVQLQCDDVALIISIVSTTA